MSSFFAAQRMLWFFVVAALFVTFRFPFFERGLSLEESTAISSGIGVLERGFPYFDIDMFTKNIAGVGHPPILNWMLGVSFYFFGVSETAARLPILLCSFLLLMAIGIFSYLLFRDWRISLCSLALFSIIPFSIQNSLQIQYDGAIVSLFVFGILASAWFFLSKDHVRIVPAGLFFISSLGLFYSKPEVWLLVGFVLAASFLLMARNKKGLQRFLIVVLLMSVSGVVYIVSYRYYNTSFGHGDLTFASTGVSVTGVLFKKITTLFQDFKTGFLWLAGSAALLYKFLMWITFPVMLLFVAALARFIKSKEWHDKRLAYLLIWIFVFFVAYLVLGYGGNVYPRYYGPLVAPLVMILAYAVVSAMGNIKKVVQHLFVVGGALFLAYIFKIHQIFLPYRGDIVFSTAGWTLALWFCAAVVVVVFSWKSEKFFSVFAPLCCSAVLVFSIAIFAADARANYVFGDNFGESGYREAGEWLTARVMHEDIVLSRNPIDYYFKGIFIDTYNSLMPFRDRIDEMLVDKEITYIAIPERTLHKWDIQDQQGGRFIYEYIQKNNLVEVARFGTIIIYENR